MSFSKLFSTHPISIHTGYFEGIIGNLELLPIYYPEWTMRVYYDLEDEDPITQVIVAI